jgi:hypothetical protein
VDRGQAQSATNIGKNQTVVNIFNQYFHEATLARGLLLRLVVKEGADLSTAAKRG